MRVLSMAAFAGASIFALSVFGGAVGLVASAQPPGANSTPTQADDADEEDEADEAGSEEPAAGGSSAGGGAALPVAAPATKPGAPAVAKTPLSPPAGAVPGTLPLGSSGNGGTGGNGRPTQDPDKG